MSLHSGSSFVCQTRLRRLERALKYKHQSAALRARATSCSALLEELGTALATLDLLAAQHSAVGAPPAQLATPCERLTTERARLLEFAAALRERLVPFEALPSLAAALHAAGAAPANDAARVLPGLLVGCAEGEAFCLKHAHYRDAASASARFRQLRSRALSATRGAVTNILRRAVLAVEEAAREELGAPPEGDSAPTMVSLHALSPAQLVNVLYVRFRAVASELPPLLGFLAAHEGANAPDLSALLADCRALFIDARASLLLPTCRQRASHAAACAVDACTLARNEGGALLGIAADEQALFDIVFNLRGPASAPADDGSPLALERLLDIIAQPAADALRLAALGLRDPDALAELVDVLRREVCSCAVLLILLTWNAIYLVQVMSRVTSAGASQSTAASALPALRRCLADAQERLAFCAHTVLERSVALAHPQSSDSACMQRATASAAGLYRPVRVALDTLSRLYGALEADTFGGLAQEAVAAAAHAVATAAAVVASGPGGEMDAALFSAAQLLALREQIAPFDAEFVVTERALEFSSMRTLLRRALAGDAPGELLVLAARGAPVRTVSSRVDGRKQLESALKASCEAFILAVTRAAVEPLLSFLAKSTAVRGGQRVLREQAFALPPRVTELIVRTNASLAVVLPDAAARACGFLPTGNTAEVLMRPVNANIVEAHAQMASLLDAEYSGEEVQKFRELMWDWKAFMEFPRQAPGGSSV